MDTNNKRLPLVSVVIPAFNAERFIGQTIDSVLAQTYRKLEIIVANDASTDRTAEILSQYTDERLRVVHLEKNGHVVCARNAAQSYATGKYIAYLDADDIWVPEKLEKQVEFMENNPEVGACFTWATIIDADNEPAPLDIPDVRWHHDSFHEPNRSRAECLMRFLSGGNYMCNSSAMVQASVIDEIGDQHLALRQLQDYEYWVRIANKADIHVISEELTKYRRLVDEYTQSTVTEDTHNRTRNEGVYVCTHFFDYMSDEDFVALFREQFRNPNAVTHDELRCEKAFFLQNSCWGDEPFMSAVQDLFGDPNTAKLLTEQYDFDQKKFYAMNKDLRYLENENRAKLINYDANVTAWKSAIGDKETHIQNLENNIEKLKKEVQRLDSEFNQVQYQYQTILNSRTMRMTKPVRAVWRRVKPLVINDCTHLLASGVRSLYRDGLADTWRRVQRSRQVRAGAPGVRYLISAAEEKEQRNAKFTKEIKFSVLVPLYNTSEKFLREMIQSVLDQNYPNWELCMADGSDAQHTRVGEVCMEYEKNDSRIKYKKLEANYGISGNTNACIEMATGDFIALFDHDDLLHPSALYEMMCAICEQGADFVYTDETTFRRIPEDGYCPHFKPDYAPDTLRANNYICHFNAFERSLLEKVGGFRSECDGSQDYDMMLRLTEQAKKIVHVPKILYYWRAHENSVSTGIDAKPYVIDAAKKALSDHLERVGLKGEVLDSPVPSMYRMRYEIEGEPLVSIIIPNYEHQEDLQKCLNSIYEKTTYDNFEIIIVENNSKSESLFRYYREIQNRWSNLKVVNWPDYFNYSAINNFGAQYTSGEHLLLLNNDVEIITPDWIQEMLMYSQRSDVGAVGAKLYYPDDTVQHGGVGIGLLTLAGHYHRGFDRNHPGYMGRLSYAQNQSAVTAACVMVRRSVWDEIGGLDESFEVAFNDIDMCMRIREAGYLIVWTPYAELYHYESKSRGLDSEPEKRERFVSEVQRFQTRWKKQLEAGDPYYNPNLSLDHEDFRPK